MMTPDQLLAVMRDHGALRMVAKRLAPNDNSKNQIYLGGDYTAIQLLPFGALREDTAVAAGSKRARMKAGVELHWITRSRGLEKAEGANLILYPKYPEVRLSGLLRGVHDPVPAGIIAPRAEGRWLFLGITGDGRILAFACRHGTPCANWAEQAVTAHRAAPIGVFHEFLVPTTGRPDIMTALRRIADRNWIGSKRLDGEGNILPCNSRNCGGYTLEAELGIRPNGRADPDYDGWEVKQFEVGNLAAPKGGRVTLMTPEPNGGLYVTAGPEAFLRKFGYADRSGIKDRINFGGVHRFGVRHAATTLQLALTGWDVAKGEMTKLGGGIELLDAHGGVAARWSFESLLNHWKRKHAKAVYVPSNCALEPRRYRYGKKVLTGIGTDFPLLLAAFARGAAFYDPGIKLENASSQPALKRRSQFRIQMKDISTLYEKTEWLDLPKEH
jgi:hypothetical protein